MDLSTTYLGMRLPHPLIVGAGPLGDDPDTVRALEDAGAAMIVLRSLYEEEITQEQMNAFVNVEGFSESFAGGDQLRARSAPVARTRRIPRASSPDQRGGRHPGDGVAERDDAGGWLEYARLLEEAGADGLELHIYHAASDMTTSAADVERQAIDIVKEVKAQPAHSGRGQARTAAHGLCPFRQITR